MKILLPGFNFLFKINMTLILNKAIRFPLSILFVIVLFTAPFLSNNSHAQCTTTNILTQNFNTGTLNTGATGTAAGTETKGGYAVTCSGRALITNNTQLINTGDVWRENTTVNPTKPPTGNDDGSSSDYAYYVDACTGMSPSLVPYKDTTIWCASVTVAPGEIYNFSAFFTTPWLQSKANDPDLYFTINGIQVGPSYTMDLWNATTNTYNPYSKYACYSTIPAGTSGTVPFCIKLKQRTGGTDAVPGSGTFGQDYQGNDVLVDDIQITKYAGAGCGTTTGCILTVPGLPVELIAFDAKRVADKEISLNWSAISDAKASYFSVEKSTNAKDFTEIGEVKIKKSENIEYYSLDDYNFNQTSYYRLKSIDNNGSYSYSDLRVVPRENNFVNVFRNAAGELELKATMENASDVTLSVYSILGIELLTTQLSLRSGENTITKAGILTDEKSTKIVRVIDANGKVLLSKVIIL
jgi:hypothetical protein